MTRSAGFTRLLILLTAALLLCPPAILGVELQPVTIQAWERYVQLTEKRIAAELNHQQAFLAIDFLSDAESRSARPQLGHGQIYIRKMETRDEKGQQIPVKDGMIHHWLGAIFIPGEKLDALIRWVQDYDQHHRYFKEVEKSRLVSREGPTFKIYYRLRRKKVITVVYNTDHTVVYRDHNSKRASSHSHTTRIAEVDSPGSPSEKEKPVGNDSGFLWRLNSYWRFQEEDGGVLVECESISLSRNIPAGLKWMIQRFVESVPRESLENTLTSIRQGTR